MIINVVWQCMLIANIISEVTSKEEALNFSPPDISSWSTGSQEGCGDSICPKGIKRCLLQKMKEKLVQRNSPTRNDQPILINSQMPKFYKKAAVNRRNLDVTLDKPLAISEIANEGTIIPTVSYQNTDYNFANTEETKNMDYPENSSIKILNDSFKQNSEEVQTKFSNREVDDIDNSTVNYSLKEIFHRNYHKYHNASYCRSNDTIMYINSDNVDEQLKSVPSNFPAMGENPEYKMLLPNNLEKYTSGEHANEDINNNPIVDFNNPNRQSSIGGEIPNGNGNPNVNSFQAGNIPKYIFIDGQYIREDGVMNKAKPPDMDYNNNLTPKVTQYNFIDGQYIPENVNENQFRSVTETQTPTEGPNIQREMNNLNNHKEIMMRPLGPLFVICSHPIFTFYIEHNLPMYQANHLPNFKVNYETLVHIWFPQL